MVAIHRWLLRSAGPILQSTGVKDKMASIQPRAQLENTESPKGLLIKCWSFNHVLS